MEREGSSASPKKRRSPALPDPFEVYNHVFREDSELEGLEDGWTVEDGWQVPIKRRKVAHVLVEGPAFPLSAFDGFTPPAPPVKELDALFELKALFDRAHEGAENAPDYTFLRLDGFSIYRPPGQSEASTPKRRDLELTSLDTLQNRNGYSELLLDGIISFGSEKRYVQGVRFQTLTIEGYDDEGLIALPLPGRICIQSPRARGVDVWYELGDPAPEYARYHKPFLWLVQFTTYFVNYLFEHENVTLHQFREHFYNTIADRYEEEPSFHTWHAYCGHLRDFATNVSRHVGFLWKECWGVDESELVLCKHPLWIEVDPQRLEAIPERRNRENKTLVTPFVYNCFRNMYFSSMIEERHVALDLLPSIRQRKQMYGLTEFWNESESFATAPPTPTSLSTMSLQPQPPNVQAGDVVSIVADQDSVWGPGSPVWYAYVQRKWEDDEDQMLDVLWLYEPSQTTLRSIAYPFKNELFFSDNCSCEADAIHASEVLEKIPVKWIIHNPDRTSALNPNLINGFFVRQKFRTVHEDDTYDFSALQKRDFRCCHAVGRETAVMKQTASAIEFERCKQEYLIGDTVLVIDGNLLEPAQIVRYEIVENGNSQMRRIALRRLRRCNTDDQNAKPNELRLTDEVFYKPPTKIIRKCHVRIFYEERLRYGIPAPYSFNGAGDYFFIKQHLLEHDPAASTNELPPLNEPMDFDDDVPTKLPGLGMFCGGGNFDRGIEDGGAVEFKYAIDWDRNAVHTYRANAKHPDKMHIFYGSVNDFIADAMKNSPDSSIAKPGDVLVIAAGSPCPGFSTMQINKNSPASLRNASMVSSVVSYVDFYSPRYCILENVIGMTASLGAQRNENVFGQILASLVALGYQVQQFFMGAWSYGSSQRRSRVFVIASAPGTELLTPPPYTHDHPPNSNLRSLGRSVNGQKFGMQRDVYTPFRHVNPVEATKDLPNIGDSQVQICPAFPDHRSPSEETSGARSRVACIPNLPDGMSLARAALGGFLPEQVMEYYKGLNAMQRAPISRTYARVSAEGLFPTILTALPAKCFRSGPVLHWTQHRNCSVMELRRAQGFLDRDVIVGRPHQQVRIIGNSVDRMVSLLLGLALHDSWRKTISAYDEDIRLSDEVDMAEPLTPAQTSTSDGYMEVSPEQLEDIRKDKSNAFKKIAGIINKQAQAASTTVTATRKGFVILESARSLTYASEEATITTVREGHTLLSSLE